MSDQEKQTIVKALKAIASALSFCDTDMELVMRDRIDAIYAAIDKLNATQVRGLLPCPFCGSEYTQTRYMGGKWQEPSAFKSGYRGECCDCGVITAAYDTEAEAIEAWNTRHTPVTHV